MKTASFLLLMISWVVLLEVTVDAATSDQVAQTASLHDGATTRSTSPPANSQSSQVADTKVQSSVNEQQVLEHTQAKNLARGRINLVKPRNPVPVPSDRVHFGSTAAANFPQSGSNRPGSTQGKGLFQTETASTGVPLHLRSAVQVAPATPSNVRHRSPNPAIISELQNSRTGNTGAVNGTRLSRRR